MSSSCFRRRTISKGSLCVAVFSDWWWPFVHSRCFSCIWHSHVRHLGVAWAVQAVFFWEGGCFIIHRNAGMTEDASIRGRLDPWEARSDHAECRSVCSHCFCHDWTPGHHFQSFLGQRVSFFLGPSCQTQGQGRGADAGGDSQVSGHTNTRSSSSGLDDDVLPRCALCRRV